uniref:Transcription factor JunD n=1 Tax=Gorilla gorilla gorilla TaxID=9595 RepID=G3S843_GORGO
METPFYGDEALSGLGGGASGSGGSFASPGRLFPGAPPTAAAGSMMKKDALTLSLSEQVAAAHANLSSYAGGAGGAGGAATVAFAAEPVPFPPPPPPGALGPPRLAALKDEPQTVPDVPSFGESPPLSPIDMDTQERIKAERKRLRNRIAASKCRKRKLERISRLEEKVKTLKSQNTELASTASLLREQVAQLKQKVLSHVNSGCQLLPQHQVPAY